MLRYLPAAIEVIGLALVTTGAFLFNPALGLAAVGGIAVAVGYRLEDAK